MRKMSLIMLAKDESEDLWTYAKIEIRLNSNIYLTVNELYIHEFFYWHIMVAEVAET